MAKKEKEQKAEETTETVAKKPRKQINLKKGGVLWVVWNYVEAALLLVGGILAIVFSSNTDLQNSILIIVGAFLIFGGALKVLMNFLPALTAEDKASLNYNFVIAGSVELALGITLVTVTSAMSSAFVMFLSTFIGIILIVAGAAFLIFAIAFIVDKLFGLVMPILEMILAAGLIALGVVVLVYMKKEEVFYQVVLIITGIIMALAGLAVLIETTRAMIAANKVKKAVKAVVPDEKKGDTVVVDATEEPKNDNPQIEHKEDEKPADDEKK